MKQVKLFQDGEFIAEFKTKDDAEAFLKKNYNLWQKPVNIPQSATECESHYRRTGEWIDWFDLLGVSCISSE